MISWDGTDHYALGPMSLEVAAASGQVIPLEAHDAIKETPKPTRTYTGREGDDRQQLIDYSNFPVGLAYISHADVVAAYKQGLRDAVSPAARLALQHELLPPGDKSS